MAANNAEPRTVFVIGFGRRLAAAVIDGLIVGALSWLLAGLWVLGPAINRGIADFLTSLK